MKLHRCPVLLGRSGTAPKLASLRHGRLFGRFALRCSARFMAQHVKGVSKGASNGTTHLLLRVSYLQSGASSADPEGAAHGWAAFSDRAMDGESENPLETRVAS